MLRGKTFAAALVLFAASADGAGAQQQFISVGTGGVTGVYYPVGGAICRLVNKNRTRHGIRCSTESTGGSIYNINTLRGGELQFGLAQSDLQQQAVTGIAAFERQGPFDDLRSVFSLHSETVTILASKESGVTAFEDLKNRRVNIGNLGSGTRGTWNILEDALGISRDDLAEAVELPSADTGRALCDGTIDAYFWLAGHPSALILETVAACDAQLVGLSGEAVDKLIADNPIYRKTEIPRGLYNNTGPIATVGVGATLVSSASVPDAIVYTLVKAVFANFREFRDLHPALSELRERDMVQDYLSAPLHPGAVRYYRERGWM
ncbi:MAG: TAXI family TRAP transporter solute-binding subunit [Pseudomonadota bacterium]